MLPLPILILIGLAGLGLLLLLIIRFKMQAFYALILVSIIVGIAAGLPLTTIPADGDTPEQLGVIQAIIAGVGGTLGSVAVLVALGSMLGKIIELSGGAESLAGRFTSWLGPKRVGIALVIAAGILAIPVFFDAGFIILIPIVFAFSKVAGLNPIKFGLPVAGIMLAVHVAVPPHPGIVGGSAILGADIGWVTIFSLAISVPLGVLSYLVAKWINTREFAMLAATKEMYDNFGTEKSTLTGGLGEGEKAPGAGTVLGSSSCRSCSSCSAPPWRRCSRRARSGTDSSAWSASRSSRSWSRSPPRCTCSACAAAGPPPTWARSWSRRCRPPRSSSS